MELDELEKSLNTDDDNLRYKTIKKEVELINNERTRGLQIRAKCTHLEANEKNTSYFFNKEQATANTKNMTKLTDDNGTTHTDPKDIMNHTKQFYQALHKQENTHTPEETNIAEKYFLKHNEIPTVDEEGQNVLNTPLTIEEVIQAIKLLPNNKSPGSDGLTIEFYKMFWPKIGDIVYNSMLYAIENGELSIDQRRGILNLIPKKGKNITSLKNWRPISLLNSDYKILAKVFATRLQSIIKQIVSPDQSGCIKGRSTFSNIRSTMDMITHTKEMSIPGILMFVDYEKAFDTVNHSFMTKCLKQIVPRKNSKFTRTMVPTQTYFKR
jgi:hypothetical protein